VLPDTLREKISFELESLNRELAETRELFERLCRVPPDAVEIRAAATSLHAFYNGIENIFYAIARHVDGIVPDGERWHFSLLRNMCATVEKRDHVISAEMRQTLEPYLAFRHFFRHSYGFILDWEQLKPLCVNRGNTFIQFEAEINKFLSNVS
jgi:hypothetical protein